MLFVLAIVTVLFLPMLTRAKFKVSRAGCINNLNNIGLAHRIFATDNDDLFVFQVPIANGGTMEFTNDVAPHYRALSNELSTPKILVCPGAILKRSRQHHSMFSLLPIPTISSACSHSRQMQDLYWAAKLRSLLMALHTDADFSGLQQTQLSPIRRIFTPTNGSLRLC